MKKTLKDFLKILVIVGIAAIIMALIPSKANKNNYRLPPRANKASFHQLCVGCDLCVVSCPTGVMEPASLDDGLQSFLKPHMNFNKSRCIGCGNCYNICPTNALKPLKK
ncbi:MAG: 4Fe-4S binding protein [Bacteroidales bacterium]|jgi:formate hydrogenlyase subunit 6/NADH:ubiquinone oxidoreductase subunit I